MTPLQHRWRTFLKATWRFSELKALVASTWVTASQWWQTEQIMHTMYWSFTSAFKTSTHLYCPHSVTASWMSALRVIDTAFPTMCHKVSPTPMGLTSLSSLHATKAYWIHVHVVGCTHCFCVSITETHPVLFDGPFIRSVALRMDGAAGPSGVDAAGWKRMCTSFSAHSADLCDTCFTNSSRDQVFSRWMLL